MACKPVMLQDGPSPEWTCPICCQDALWCECRPLSVVNAMVTGEQNREHPMYAMYKDKLKNYPSVYDMNEEYRLIKTGPSWVQLVRDKVCGQ